MRNDKLGRPGRPVGLTWAYLECAHRYDTKLEHQAAILDWGSLTARQRARIDFHTHPKASSYEEAEYGGPTLEEPRFSDL
jgi:hypothetical protein